MFAFFLSILLLCTSCGLSAQTEQGAATILRPPEIAGFNASGWMLETQAEGPLVQAAIQDWAGVFQRPVAGEDEVVEFRLVVAFRQRDGKLKKIAERDIDYFYDVGGFVNGPHDWEEMGWGSGDNILTIKNRCLTVGSGNINQGEKETYRFQDGGFLLIGLHGYQVHTGGDVVSAGFSYNLNTGLAIRTGSLFDRSSEANCSESLSTSRYLWALHAATLDDFHGWEHAPKMFLGPTDGFPKPVKSSINAAWFEVKGIHDGKILQLRVRPLQKGNQPIQIRIWPEQPESAKKEPGAPLMPIQTRTMADGFLATFDTSRLMGESKQIALDARIEIQQGTRHCATSRNEYPPILLSSDDHPPTLEDGFLCGESGVTP